MLLCLLENGADVQAPTATGDTVLHTALRSLQGEYLTLEIVKVLICHGCDPLGASLSEKTLVHIALKRGFPSVARYFLSLGVPPSADLILVVFEFRFKQEQERLQMLRCLLGNGANVHACTTAGDTFLGIALRSFLEDKHALEALKLLVRHGCNPFECDSHGKTPLCIAVEQGRISLIGFLLTLGPSLSLVSDLLWVALSSNRFRPKSQMVNFLIDHGASIFVQAQNGDTLLHLAITSLDNDEVLPLVELLLRRGCNPMMRNDSGTTPLHVAIERGRIFVVEFLLSQNVQPPPDILFTAIQSNPTLSPDVRLKLVEALVTFGCNTQTCNAVGQTPLEAAYLGGHVDVGDYLTLEYPPVQAGRIELASRGIQDTGVLFTDHDLADTCTGIPRMSLTEDLSIT
ncbi:Ankyrin repeat-containing domain protein [Tylopilus felleus]